MFMFTLSTVAVHLVCMVIQTTCAFGIPYKSYIVAPSSRVLHPVSIYAVNGSVDSAESLLVGMDGTATLDGVCSVTVDYGKNIAGLVSVSIRKTSSPNAFIGLSYTESSIWISSRSSDATNNGVDEIIWLDVGQSPGTYSVDRVHERGAFRYLTLITNTTAEIVVSEVITNFTAAPLQDPQDYTGYFHSNDELVNRIWYAGAYTNQLCTIDPRHGDSLGGILRSDGTSTWFNSHVITAGESCLVDGAKRDRVVWPGDMAVSLPSIFVSTNDLYSVKNSINSILEHQAPSGMLPYSGIPINGATSFTYHLHSLIGIALLYRYSGDRAYLTSIWAQFVHAIDWVVGFIDDSKLLYVTSDADWLRHGMGGHNIEANAILFSALNHGLTLAEKVNDSSAEIRWRAVANGIKQAANALLWNSTLGMYHDNETTTLAPQDGNSWALKSNLTLNSSQKMAISRSLQRRWGPYGAPAPEAGTTISPFIGGIELEGHFLANKPQYSLALLRLQWGYMLDGYGMTNSTFIEGYSMDGSLRYPPYSNNYRVSHAHGWSTAPTSLLSFYVAGIHLESASGATWLIAPQLGDLTSVEAGFATSLGKFSISVITDISTNRIIGMNFTTPSGTSGDVSLPGARGFLTSSSGNSVKLTDGKAQNLKGGNWYLSEDRLYIQEEL